MSLRPEPVPPVPEQTALVAHAAFPRGNPYLLLRDRLGAVFADAAFADLFPALGRPAYAPWRLALVTVMQFRENLSDRQAADAVRARIDWKYLLALDLVDAGFDHSVLCEFRTRKTGVGRYAYAINPLLDLDTDCILGVEATPARSGAEVAATCTLIERVEARLGIAPERLAADKPYGSPCGSMGGTGSHSHAIHAAGRPAHEVAARDGRARGASPHGTTF